MLNKVFAIRGGQAILVSRQYHLRENEIIMLVFSITAKELYDAAMAKLKRRSPDLRASILQIKQAADIGYIPAKIKLAWSYLYGEGVELDFDKAREIFETLAEEGNAEAHAVS